MPKPRDNISLLFYYPGSNPTLRDPVERTDNMYQNKPNYITKQATPFQLAIHMAELLNSMLP